MLRLIFGSNGRILRNIVTKWLTATLRNNGLTAQVKCEDFVVYRDGDNITIHVNGDVTISEKELLTFIDNKISG